jgi:hypothetical protein
LLYTLQATIRNENSAEWLDYEKAREWFINPTSKMLQDINIRKEIYLFVSKFVSRIYGIRMINAWLSKKKGSTFFDLMTMSDFAYTVAVLENSYEVWDQQGKQEHMSTAQWKEYINSDEYIKKTPKFTDRKGKKREYCDSGWTKAGIQFFDDVRQRWRKLSSQNTLHLWSDLEKGWTEYAEEINFGNTYTRRKRSTRKDTSSDTSDNEEELPPDRFDFENEDCPWKKRDYEGEYGSDLGSTGGRYTRPQKRSKRSDIGRVSLESADDMQAGIPPLPVEDEDDEAETSTFEDDSVVLGV